MFDPSQPNPGMEWLVDAFGCSPAVLRDVPALERLFQRAIVELGLHPIGRPLFHSFGGAGGVTGMVMLSESHLTCHTFPERAYAAFDLYCCREREGWPWSSRLAEHLAAARVAVTSVQRPSSSSLDAASPSPLRGVR